MDDIIDFSAQAKVRYSALYETSKSKRGTSMMQSLRAMAGFYENSIAILL